MIKMIMTYPLCKYDNIDWSRVAEAKGFYEPVFGSHLVPLENSFQLAEAADGDIVCRFTGTLPENPEIADTYSPIVKDESMEIFFRNPAKNILQFIANPKGAAVVLVNGKTVELPFEKSAEISGNKFEIILKFTPPADFNIPECELRVWRNSLQLIGGCGLLVWEGTNHKSAWHRIAVNGSAEGLNSGYEDFYRTLPEQPLVHAICQACGIREFTSASDLLQQVVDFIHGIPASENSIDFAAAKGKFRLINGTNLGPCLNGGKLNDYAGDFRQLKYTTCRLHDAPLLNPGCRIVDIDQIFGRHDADPADPGNYYFEQTDDYLQNIIDNNSEIIYRLGNSIEWSKKLYFARRPADYERFAEVCAGIVRHYNHGWANGFRHGIKYWEIWNEADHPCMWDGSFEDYFKLYKTVALRLKREFPDIRIGGPAATKISSALCREFIDFCAGEKLPLDFFSFHCYETSFLSWLESITIARIVLNMAGFSNAEIHLNEWHYRPAAASSANMASPEGKRKFYPLMNGVESAAFTASALLRAQDSPLTVSNYYLFGKSPAYGMYDAFGGKYPNLYGMQKIGTLFADFPERFECVSSRKDLTISGGFSADGKTAAVLVADMSSESRINIRLKNLAGRKITAFALTADRGFVPADWEMKHDQLILKKSAEAALFHLEITG